MNFFIRNLTLRLMQNKIKTTFGNGVPSLIINDFHQFEALFKANKLQANENREIAFAPKMKWDFFFMKLGLNGPKSFQLIPP